MPILKQIAGHGTCVPVQKYLEKNGRALARDFLNIEDAPDADLMVEPSVGPAIEWAKTMDEFRAANGNDEPWNGRAARTFKHFVLSPSPDDNIDLQALRDITHAWVRRYFEEFQVAIVYHNDNESRIPHAHIVVSNTNVVTGNRMHHDDPRDLNRGLQELSAERGLHALSNERPEPKTGFERLAVQSAKPTARPITLQEDYRSRAERRAQEQEGYSWVADIRSRVNVAKNLARNEGEFTQILKMLGVEVSENSRNARRPDWIFSLADTPTRRVSGERLGASYGRGSLERKFVRAKVDHLSDKSSRELLRLARSAVDLKNLDELDMLAGALETCGRWHITSIDAATTAIVVQRGRLDAATSESRRNRIIADIVNLEETREFLQEHNVVPAHNHEEDDSGDTGRNWSNEPASGSWGAPDREQSRDERTGWDR